MTDCRHSDTICFDEGVERRQHIKSIICNAHQYRGMTAIFIVRWGEFASINRIIITGNCTGFVSYNCL